MSRRVERVSHLLRSLIADAILTRLNDPRIARFTSVTKVETSPDLSFARVFISVMGSESEENSTLKGLTHAAGRIREFLKDHIEMRQVPGLVFEIDQSLKKAAAMVEQLDRIKGELDARGEVAPTPESELAPKDDAGLN